MNKNHIVNLINSFEIFQSENIFILGCAKNIVHLRKLNKEQQDTIDILLKKVSQEPKFNYFSPTGKVKDLIPKEDGNISLVIPYEDKEGLDSLIKELETLGEEPVEIPVKLKLEDLENKLNSDWKPSNPIDFSKALNFLMEIEAF